MEFPNCLNYFVAQAKKDINAYIEENADEGDLDSYFEEMEHLLFNFNAPEIDVGDCHFQLARKRDCYQMIDNDAEMLWEIIEWVSVESSEYDDNTDLSKGITHIFALAWYFVGKRLIENKNEETVARNAAYGMVLRYPIEDSDSDDEPTMSEIKALVADLA